MTKKTKKIDIDFVIKGVIVASVVAGVFLVVKQIAKFFTKGEKRVKTIKKIIDVEPREALSFLKMGSYNLFGKNYRRYIEKYFREILNKIWDRAKNIKNLADDETLQYRILEMFKHYQAHTGDNPIQVYNIRKNRNNDTWSYHSYGVAVDLIPKWLPMKKEKYDIIENIPKQFGCTMRTLKKLLNEFESSGYIVWGANWRSIFDPMHIQINDIYLDKKYHIKEYVTEAELKTKTISTAEKREKPPEGKKDDGKTGVQEI